MPQGTTAGTEMDEEEQDAGEQGRRPGTGEGEEGTSSEPVTHQDSAGEPREAAEENERRVEDQDRGHTPSSPRT